MPDNIFNAKVHTISPVHIGSGRSDLMLNYDFVTEGGKIWIIDHERMFEIVPDEVFNKVGFDAPINKLLKQDQYKQCSKYSLNNLPGVNKIVEQIKTAHSCPYIPGSSLKGAIRNALAYAMVKGGVIKIRTDDMGKDPRFADNTTERKLFGIDPNHDAMRALQVSDTEGVKNIALNSVAIYSLRDRSGEVMLISKGQEYTFSVEVIPENTNLSFSIKIDNYLFKDKNSQELGFDKKKGWVMNFAKHCNDFARDIIDIELQFYDKYHVPKIKAFYEKLNKQLQEIDPIKQFLLHISWGAGWASKTIIGNLRDDDLLGEIVEKFRLDKGKGYPIFPKTRRIIERGYNNPVAEMPLGWIKVDLS